jgi:hypothetical protein
MEENDLIEIKTSLLTLEESMKLFSTLKFSWEFTIYGPDCFIRGYWTQGEIRGFHAIPKETFEL